MEMQGVQVRLEGAMETIRFQMAQFIDLEIEKRKEELKGVLTQAVTNFDVVGEARRMFDSMARTRILEAVRVEAGRAAYDLVREWEFEITIRPKAGQPKGAQEGPI